jgi:hypothetical protein
MRTGAGNIYSVTSGLLSAILHSSEPVKSLLLAAEKCGILAGKI